jgi:hypothetical protein
MIYQVTAAYKNFEQANAIYYDMAESVVDRTSN